MAKFQDLTGQKFGTVNVISQANDKISENGCRTIMWNCVCDCGNHFVTSSSSLKNLKTCRKCMGEDLTGKKFGRLTVLRRGGYKGREKLWWCQCDCGSAEKLIYGKYLKNGKTKSCGCYSSELTKEYNKTKKKYNQYDLSGEYGIGWTWKGEEFYFDKEDYDLIKDYTWQIANGYVVNRDGLHMSWIIMFVPPNMYVHHKGDKNDVRKSNLEITTKSGYMQDRDVSKANKSGCKGVHWHKRDKVWTAYICVDGKQIYLGQYDDYDEAVQVRKDAEEQYFNQK